MSKKDKLSKRTNLLAGFTPLEKIKVFGKQRSLTGFTLVEVVMIVAIILLTSITIGVSLSTFSPRSLENKVQKLAADLSWARTMAKATHCDYLIDFDADGDTILDGVYTIAQIDRSLTPAVTSIIAVKKLDFDTIGLYHNAGVSLAPPRFNFSYTSGGLNSTIIDPVTIVLRSRGLGAIITIRNLTGHVSWERL